MIGEVERKTIVFGKSKFSVEKDENKLRVPSSLVFIFLRILYKLRSPADVKIVWPPAVTR